MYLKDLSKLGRDISWILIVDNNPESFLLQAENGIYIKSWYDDQNDQALKELSFLLKNLVESGHNDVRKGLTEIRQKQLTKTIPSFKI